jgi:hypothetical protein
MDSGLGIVNDYVDASIHEQTLILRRHNRVQRSLTLYSLMPKELRASTELLIGTTHKMIIPKVPPLVAPITSNLNHKLKGRVTLSREGSIKEANSI